MDNAGLQSGGRKTKKTRRFGDTPNDICNTIIVRESPTFSPHINGSHHIGARLSAPYQKFILSLRKVETF